MAGSEGAAVSVDSRGDCAAPAPRTCAERVRPRRRLDTPGGRRGRSRGRLACRAPPSHGSDAASRAPHAAAKMRHWSSQRVPHERGSSGTTVPARARSASSASLKYPPGDLIRDGAGARAVSPQGLHEKAHGFRCARPKRCCVKPGLFEESCSYTAPKCVEFCPSSELFAPGRAAGFARRVSALARTPSPRRTVLDARA